MRVKIIQICVVIRQIELINMTKKNRQERSTVFT